MNSTTTSLIFRYESSSVLFFARASIRWLENFIQERPKFKRKANLQVIAPQRNLQDIAKHPDGLGCGLLALLARDPESKAPYINVDYRRQAILAALHGRFAEATIRYRSKRGRKRAT